VQGGSRGFGKGDEGAVKPEGSKFEAQKAEERVGYLGGATSPSPPARDLGSTVSSPAGSGTKPQPRLVLVWFEAQTCLITSFASRLGRW